MLPNFYFFTIKSNIKSLIQNLVFIGLPICVVATKTDLFDELERSENFKDEQFSYKTFKKNFGQKSKFSKLPPGTALENFIILPENVPNWTSTGAAVLYPIAEFERLCTSSTTCEKSAYLWELASATPPPKTAKTPTPSTKKSSTTSGSAKKSPPRASSTDQASTFRLGGTASKKSSCYKKVFWTWTSRASGPVLFLMLMLASGK